MDAQQQATPIALTIPDASRRLGVSPKTVRRLVSIGAIPSYRVGRLIRIDESDLNDWKQRQRRGGRAA